MSCLSTVSYTINVNGELTTPFEARKGLRQGDPISSYLFVICMEYLNRCLKELRTNREFRYHPRCKKLQLIHLCFADDLLLFTRGDAASVKQLMITIQKFTEASGLKANQQKSCIYFGGVDERVREEILQLSGMSQGQLPFKYLGVPLSAQKLNVVQCMPLIKKILERVDCWASKLLTYAGRVQLIRSVLFGIQVYWCQIFLLPQKVLKLIQTACRTFLWTGKSALSKRALVAWDKVSMSRNNGGLGIVNMKLWNRAAIGKMFWNLARKKDDIWIKWIHEFYIKDKDVLTMAIPQQCSWVMRKIMGARCYFGGREDAQEWLHQQRYSIRIMYKKMVGELPSIAWTKLVCHNAAPPKCIFVSWLLMHNSMPTCEYLARIGILVDSTCCFCENAQETREHLFFGCTETGYVWSEVKKWCGMLGGHEVWQQEREKLIACCKTRSGRQCLYRGAFVIVVYQVWRERNMRRLQGIKCELDAVVQRCKTLIAWCGSKDSRIGRALR